ncbi:alfa-L-rhamnosidase [Aspergillus ambiguus]|uniref:glycoside hydrolase family 78 protein n=1 Tax=Aspergillus ambiguus TaxID=176160 RepID=UPI003CCD642A
MFRLIAPLAPSFEQHPSGLGIGVASPRLSWRFTTSKEGPQGWEQTAYEIEMLRESASGPKKEDYRVASNDSLLVPWPSTPLSSRERASVRVRVYGTSQGEEIKGPTDWSPWTTVEAAFLDRECWLGRPITAGEKEIINGPLQPMRFRRVFTLPFSGNDIERARLYITSLGVYHAYINGHSVGNHCMAPGWTSYHHHLNYQVFNVAHLLNREGLNVIAVEVGEGWYATRLGFGGGPRHIYGSELGPLVQLEVQSQQNELFKLVTDSSWKYQLSAILRSEIYDGEIYDARKETDGWKTSTEDSLSWKPVRELDFPQAELIASDAPPVRVTEKVLPEGFFTTPSGKTVVDFGQNLVGRLLVTSIQKPRGHLVSFTHAEVLENGEIGTRPLREAACVDTLISAGQEINNWSPQFTWHGFRYVQIDGWGREDNQDPLLPTSLCALVLHTDMTRTGWFSCSHPMVNQLHKNALWSMRSNFLSIPTDCPQRDERLGWTGDIQVFSPSANFLYNTAGMLGGWLKDVAAEQLEDGAQSVPPFVVPNVVDYCWPRLTPQAVWDDVVVLLPWNLYRSYGDIAILRRQYPSMVAWVDNGIRRGPDRLWDPDIWQLGDWLDPTAPPVEPGDARTNGTLVADAYLVHVTSVLAQISQVLNEKEDAARYSRDAEQLKILFQNKYITSSGLVVGDTQTALALVIVFKLYSTQEQLTAMSSRLAYLVKLAKFRVSTGFAGTPIITHALSSTGNHQLAYRMLLEKNRPSWMYPITMGATTIWERWDSMLPDGTINPGEMTSFNHYALGSIINWLHQCVAGVSPIEPGWKKILIAPAPGGTIDSAEAIYDTPYGRLECCWSIREKDCFVLDLTVPPNSKALVVLPHEQDHASNSCDEANGSWVGSGKYKFSSRWDNLANWPPKMIIPIMRTPEPDQIA